MIVYRREVEVDRYHMDGVVGGIRFGEGIFERVEDAVVELLKGSYVRVGSVISKVGAYLRKRS